MHTDCQARIPTKMLSGRPCLLGSLRWSEAQRRREGGKDNEQLLGAQGGVRLLNSLLAPVSLRACLVLLIVSRGATPFYKVLPLKGVLLIWAVWRMAFLPARGLVSWPGGQWVFYT